MRVVQITARDPENSIAGLETTDLNDVYTTGDIYYVNSNTGSNTNTGLTPSTPFATLGAALSIINSNTHDVIYIMPAHAETLSAATTIAASGISILGLGNGANRPTFTMDTATSAGWDVSGSSVSICNIIFKCDIDSLANIIDVQGAYCSIEDCEFWEGTAKQFVTAIDITTTASDNCKITGCTIMSATVGATCGIDISAACNNLTIANCKIMGEFSSAPIWSDAAFTLSLISNNALYNATTGQFALELTAAATGLCCDNRLYSDAGATCFDPGSMANFNNEVCNAVDTGSHELPTTGDDVTGIYSDTTIIASDLVIAASDIVLIYSDTTVVASDTTVIESDTTVVESDTTVIESDTTVIESDTTQIASDLLLVYSDTTIIASDVVIVVSDTTQIASDLLLVYSDTTIIASDVVIVVSDTTQIASDLLLAYSDTTAIHSDTTAMHTQTTTIASDLVIVASDLLLVYSDTTIIYSDTTLLTGYVGRAGIPVGKGGVVADNALPNNTQGTVLCTATGGDVLIEKIILSKDSTLMAGPTNVEISSNNVYGPTGADSPHAAVAVAELGARQSVDLASAGVTALVPFVLESGKILAIHGSDGVGSSAGNIKYAIMGRNMTAAAYLA